jgi:hypothetical protein
MGSAWTVGLNQMVAPLAVLELVGGPVVQRRDLRVWAQGAGVDDAASDRLELVPDVDEESFGSGLSRRQAPAAGRRWRLSRGCPLQRPPSRCSRRRRSSLRTTEDGPCRLTSTNGLCSSGLQAPR